MTKSNRQLERRRAAIEEALRKLTPAERAAREELLADPGSWAAPSEPIEAVEYTLDVRLDPRQRDRVRELTGGLQLFHPEQDRVSMRVAHGSGWLRVEMGSGLLGAGSAIIRSRDGAALYLDLKARTFLHMTVQQLPQWSDRPTSLQIRAADGSSISMVAGPLRAQVEFDGDPTLEPFAAAAIRAVLGIEPSWPGAQQLPGLGFPRRGSTWLSEDRATDPAFQWSIDNVNRTTLARDVFSIPEGWVDLRDVERVAELAPRGGHRFEVGQTFSPHYPGIDPSLLEPLSIKPVPVGTVQFPQLDEIGACIPAIYGCGAGLHLEQLALDDLRTIANLVLRRVQYFQGEGGRIRVDWLKQLRSHSQQLADGDGLYHLLRWEPDPSSPWPPLPTDDEDVRRSKRHERFGGLGLLDRFGERGARNLLASNHHAQLGLPAAVLAACNNLVADANVAPRDRFDRLPPEDQTVLRELFTVSRIGYQELKYKTESDIEELPKGNEFPADLVRYKLYDLGLNVELHVPDQPIEQRADVLEELSISGPNSITGKLRLHRMTGNAVVLRWPGWAYGKFAAGVALSCFFSPMTCALVAPLAGVATWLVLDAASVEITLRSPRVAFVVSWVPDPTKNDQRLYPTVQVEIKTTSRAVLYVSMIPDGIHSIIDAVISLGLSFTTEVEDALQDEIRDVIQDLLRDDAKLTYPPEQGLPGETVHSAGAFPATMTRLGLGAFYNRPQHVYMPYPWFTQVDVSDEVFARMTQLAPRYLSAFPMGPSNATSRPYAVVVWSSNLINAHLWRLWSTRQFDFPVPQAPLGDLLTAAVSKAFPTLSPHPDKMRLLAASPPRFELTPWTHAGGALPGALPAAPLGDTYARVTFDDMRLCAPLRNSTAVLELAFPASAIVDVVPGTVSNDGRLHFLDSPEGSFDLMFDVPSTVLGPWSTAGVRITQGFPAQPLGVDDVAFALADAMRVLLQRRRSPQDLRLDTDARNVQRYGEGPFALTCVMVPEGGNLYAYWGLPVLNITSDPVGWLGGTGSIPTNRAFARFFLLGIDQQFGRH